MTQIPFEDPLNPWIRTAGLSSLECGLSPYVRVDLVCIVGTGRYAYETNVAAIFPSAEGSRYVLAYRPHGGGDYCDAIDLNEARRRARVVADALSDMHRGILGAA